MVQLVCRCLNVTINCLATNFNPVDVSQLGVPVTDTFFQNQVFTTNLDSKSVAIAQNNLFKTRQNGKFSISSCLNCSQDTHAIYGSNEKVLINLALERDQEKIKLLKEAENYSKLFKIVLPSLVDQTKKSALDLKLQSKSCHLETVIQAIRQQATGYLCAEQKEMDDRIRQYTEQQYTDYNALQTRIMAERQALISLLVQVHSSNDATARTIELPSSIASFPSPPTSPDNSENTPSSEYAFDKVVPKTVVNVSSTQIAANNSHSRQIPIAREMNSSYRYNRRSQDNAAIFDMDGLEDESAPFPLSDDEADTDDSTTDDLHSIHRRIPHDHPSNLPRPAYATSLPISVPLWSAMGHTELSDDDDKNPTPDPQQIAASIQALALSIRDDKEMFGDLPRRRLNTGDLVKSRPI